MSFQDKLAKSQDEVNQIIKKYLPAEEGFQKVIFESMNYSIHVGGKRIRPILMLETYRAFGGNEKLIEPFMVAMECIHTYSLVHDDLPAMDNDLYRRGQLTTHAKYGETLGILAGDALLNYAYEMIAKAFCTFPVNRNMAEAFSILSEKAGVYGMVGGQVVDVTSDQLPSTEITKEKVDFIYSLKTGALIEASMMIGAKLAGASDQMVQQIEEIASKLGLAFQIQDDILDVTSTLEELGKPIGSDEKNHKPTYVTFRGIEMAAKDVERLSLEAIAEMESLPMNYAYLKELFIYLIHRSK